jgi:hypothetical protein
MKKNKNENQKTFTDLTTKSWFVDGQKIKVGENLSDIMSGKVLTIEVKDLFFGDTYNTWKIVTDKEDKIYLLKSCRQLK